MDSQLRPLSGPAVRNAATLKGDAVINPQGEDLANIEAVMLDVSTGRIAYAVLSFGGFFGMGTKLFAIPWAALTPDADRKRFTLHVDKDTLDDAPLFDQNSWPTMADSAWARQLHAYYGIAPYWDQARGPDRV